MTRMVFWNFAIYGSNGSLKKRAGRIQSGHTGGRRTKIKMRRWRKKLLNGGKKKTWGTLRIVMQSRSLIGMRTYKMVPVIREVIKVDNDVDAEDG